MPASASASSSTRPAGPTNGRPSRSSRSPGCSPTKTISAFVRPSPKTVCVPVFQSGQARQPAAASRRLESVRRSGTSGSAVAVARDGTSEAYPVRGRAHPPLLVPLVGGRAAVARALRPRARYVGRRARREDLAFRVRHLALAAPGGVALAEAPEPAQEAVHGIDVPGVAHFRTWRLSEEERRSASTSRA